VNLRRENARKLAVVLGWARVGLGLVALGKPSVPLSPWIGADRDRASARLLARALGGRDLALGLGPVLAARHDAPLRGWIEAGGVADTGDVVATLIAFAHLPKRGRWIVLGAAGGGVVAARLLAGRVD
jgi:hypothetical protein